MRLIWTALVGFVVGLIARAVLPGSQKIGLLMTMMLGVAGALVAGFLGEALGLYHAGRDAGFLGSVVGAVLVLWAYGKLSAPQR